jgi:carboxymethylenebutenolidase
MADHDLAALWEAHCRYEFEARDVDATMASMMEEPYVNHVPTMTGGVGHEVPSRIVWRFGLASSPIG